MRRDPLEEGRKEPATEVSRVHSSVRPPIEVTDYDKGERLATACSLYCLEGEGNIIRDGK